MALCHRAIVLTFFGIVVAVASVLGFRRFREIETEAKNSVKTVTEIAEAAKRHLEEIERNRHRSDEIVRGMNAEIAADDPGKAKQAVENVLENSKASLIDKAIANAVALQQQGKQDEAIKKWHAVANIAAGSDNDLAARACFSAGYLLIMANSPNDAIADFNQAIILKPDYANAYYNRGAAKAMLRRYNDAIADYDAAIILKPDYADAYSNRGGLKAALGKHNDAIADHNEAIHLRSDNGNAYSNRGYTKAAMGLKDEARKDFKTALDLARDANNTTLAAQMEKLLRDLDDAED